MRNRYLITHIAWNGKDYLIAALFDEKPRMIEVTLEPKDASVTLGNIYIGRVSRVVPNLNAAFLEIGKGMHCYYSMEDYRHPLFTHKTGKKPLCIGDELVVQVSKEAVKTKNPVVTTNLNFTGKYLVLTTENTSVGVSSKLPSKKRDELKSALMQLHTADLQDEFGVIVRTSAANADFQDIRAEYEQFKREYFELKESCVHKTAFSLLRAEKPFYIKELESHALSDEDEIVTDCRDIYDSLVGSESLANTHIRLYDDLSYPLNKLYSLESELIKALSERVWLKSGAYLIISPTEALTVIDVNSGRNIKGKQPQETFLKINQEAALEIARQLRLRNISGICIVDFISLDSRDAERELMHVFRMALKKDRIPVELVDITKLGLVELTRRKVRKPLAEQLRDQNNPS